MKTRITLYADEGKILTNGNVYGKVIHLAEDMDSSEFWEISDSEYESIMAEMEDEI